MLSRDHVPCLLEGQDVQFLYVLLRTGQMDPNGKLPFNTSTNQLAKKYMYSRI